MKGLLLCVLLAGCGDKEGTSDDTAAANTEDAGAKLARYLSGAFDSVEQSKADRSYYAISLVTCAAEVPDLGDTVLYVEQALADDLENPYRQRLYVIETIDETSARSRIFELDRPRALVGACDSDSDSGEPITGLTADDAVEKLGCKVVMSWDGDEAVGGTEGTGCETDINDADYASSEITLSEAVLASWDRGFFSDGEQAWGATDGPYLFVRRTDLEPAQ